MIYEVRTCRVKPRTLAEATRRMSEAYPARSAFSPMLACWQSEIGPLNLIMQIWPYESLAHRDAVRAEVAAKAVGWPPQIGDLIVSLRSEIMVPLACSPLPQPGEIGPYFDYHDYVYPTGELPRIDHAWSHALPDRQVHGPIVAVWSCEFGDCNRLVHIAAYRTLEDYTQTRARVAAGGRWPPSMKDVNEGGPGYDLLSQDSMMMRALPFSPIR